MNARRSARAVSRTSWPSGAISLSAIVDDSTNWDDLVRALKSDDHAWADATISLETLATRDFNAVWIYKPDLSLFHSKNNRYAESLREAPIPREALQRLLGTREVAHFFVNTPAGWMELRGGTIHPSRDRFRETPPQGYFLAGRFWIDENIRRMSAFTGYSIRVVPVEKAAALPKSGEEQGLITFRRTFPGWDGRPVAELQVESDSPLIREFNRAGRHLFIGLIVVRHRPSPDSFDLADSLGPAPAPRDFAQSRETKSPRGSLPWRPGLTNSAGWPSSS